MNSWLRLIFLVYFITHIPITICVDMQGLFGSLYPESLQSIFRWYVSTYNDVLMANPPFWLKSFLYAEAVVQFPFFFVAVYALLKKRNWIRIPGIFYGVHVSTTVVPLLCEIIGSSLLSKNEKLTLVSFYFPYFLIPLWFALELAKRNQVWPSKEIKNA